MQGDRSAILAPKHFGNLARGLGIQVGDCHLEAVGVEPLGNYLSDALAAACDEGDLTVVRACDFLTPVIRESRNLHAYACTSLLIDASTNWSLPLVLQGR